MSALAGDLDDALEAYQEAARLVPERTLPFASQGTVLHRLDRWPEAAEVFDTALRLTPDDEATLRARATAREERGMQSGAAADLERLAFVLDVAGRAPEAANVARRADELDPTPARAALAERLARSASPNVVADAEPEAASGEPEAGPGAIEDSADADGPVWPATDDLDVEPLSSLRPDDGSAGAGEDGAHWPAIDLPTPPPPPMVGPPPDTEQVMAEASALFDVGDTAGAIERMLTAVAVHRGAGRLDAALDVCFQLLTISPGDPHVHLAIANLQLDRGWTPLAREKIDLLLRLTSLTGDTQAEADTLGLASERLRDEPVTAASRP
jgi:tetratricopeptide (TPR) repeat protein